MKRIQISLLGLQVCHKWDKFGFNKKLYQRYMEYSWYSWSSSKQARHKEMNSKLYDELLEPKQPAGYLGGKVIRTV